MLSIDFNYGTDKVKVRLPGKINIVRGNSGTGKTYLSKVLLQLCDQGFKVLIFDFSNYVTCNTSLIKELKEDTILIFDNADLYMDSNLRDAILDTKATVLIFTRDTQYFTFMNSSVCVVSYDGQTLEVRGDRNDDYF